jgi:O-antigen/teichoic acid export membrane protein
VALTPSARVSRRGAVQFGLRYGIGFLVNLAGTIVIARSGGPVLWGMLAVAQLVVALFAFLSLGAWGYLIQKPEVPDRDDVGSCYVYATLAMLAWAVVVAAAAPAIAAHLFPDPGTADRHALVLVLASAVVAGLPYGWRYVAVGLAERDHRYGIAASAELSDLVAFNAAAITLAWAGRPLEGVILGNLLRGLVSMLVAHIGLRRAPLLRARRDRLGRIARFSTPFVGFQTLQWLPSNAGPVFAGVFVGVGELGILQLAFRTVEYARVLVTIGGRIAFGLFARGDRAAPSPQAVARALDALLLLLVPGMTGLVALAPLWVPLVYGPQWSRMSLVMLLVMFPFLVMALASMVATLLSARGEVHAPLRLYAAYNALYWPAVAALCVAFGMLGLPAAEWAALAACALVLPAVQARLGARRLVLARVALALVATAVAAGLWLLATHGHGALAALSCAILAALWVATSPMTSELREWASR